MSKIYGLTGGIAAGKTTILELFQDRGCLIYNADKVARQVVEPGTSGLKELTKQFSKHILMPNGTLNRKKLGRIVFSDKRQLKILNSIMGPLIRHQIVSMIETIRADPSDKINIFEVQLLFEHDYQQYFDGTIAAFVDQEVQLKRLMKRNNLDQQAALDQINTQMPMSEKRELADFVLDNSTDIKTLENQIDQLLKQL